jgi:hypothetical protein
MTTNAEQLPIFGPAEEALAHITQLLAAPRAAPHAELWRRLGLTERRYWLELAGLGPHLANCAWDTFGLGLQDDLRRALGLMQNFLHGAGSLLREFAPE